MSLLKQYCLVNGQWIASTSEKTADVTNPSTGKVVATVPQLQESEVEDAVEAAHQAWLSWRDTPAKERSRLLKKWFELLSESADEIANIMVQEQGKPLNDAKAEMAYANSFIEWFAEEAKRAYGKTLPSPNSHDRLWTLKQPVGVCGIITPWNFPAAMITRKVGPALAAGCSCVIKPAMQTPLTALAMAALAEKAGIPKGVINVVTGDAKMIGQVLTTHDRVRKVSFTGSTQVGRLLMEQSASTIKKLSLELGGNAPFLVFDDADIEAAVDGLIKAKFRNTGQVCIAPNRVYVQSAIYEKFAELLSEQVSTLTVADGLQEGADIGPLIDQDGLEKVQSHVRDALDKGAQIVVGGQVHELGGTFYQPTVLRDVSADALLTQEETFGPVIPLIRFETEQEAIEQANDTIYGLAAYFFSQDIARVFRVSEAIEAGMVGVNSGSLSNAASPFGGVKQSGLGREGGEEGLEEYLETKYVRLGNI